MDVYVYGRTFVGGYLDLLPRSVALKLRQRDTWQEAESTDNPPRLGCLALDYADDELLENLIQAGLATYEEGLMSAPSLLIPALREEELVAALKEAGFEAERDDRLLAGLIPW